MVNCQEANSGSEAYSMSSLTAMNVLMSRCKCREMLLRKSYALTIGAVANKCQGMQELSILFLGFA